MEELPGDQATWQFDGHTIRIRFRAGWSKDPMLTTLGQCEVPVAAVAAVDFTPRERRRRWTLRLQLHERTDPYAAVGAMLTKHSRPFRLTGPDRSALLAEYCADQIEFAARRAAADRAGAPVPPDLALRLVPPVPVHIRTSEGTAGFDGSVVRLVWSGSSASARKGREQRREFPLDSIRAIEWAPSDGWEWGHLRVLTTESPDDGAEPAPGKPKHDLRCLLFNEGKEQASALLLAATITAHVWAHRDDDPAVLPAGPGAVDSDEIYERIRQLGRLHAEGILTDAEFETKKAQLLARL